MIYFAVLAGLPAGLPPFGLRTGPHPPSNARPRPGQGPKKKTQKQKYSPANLPLKLEFEGHNSPLDGLAVRELIDSLTERKLL